MEPSAHPPHQSPSPLPAPLPPGSPQVPYGPQPIVHWKKRLVIDRMGHQLPTDRCVKCNAPAEKVKRKTLYWNSPVYLLLLLAGLLPFLIVVLLVRKDFTVQFGSCKKCARRPWLLSLVWLGVLALCIYLIGLAISAKEFGLMFGGFFLVIGILIAWVLTARSLFPAKIDERWVHLRGCCAEYRQSFPSVQHDPR